ncbi:hypothetical protein BO71DRAFT_313491 [Aspergillus ellipticus CBS 707.79]|uniref:Uncharacterized protein n=1 Tax=Aspergillus ellipticus CBS 707.79 TaxID=1448320 RepID=A0A319DPS0_9EURO|nr:hypothetical protein BO71DRAFT_313491 [Aspergillus ellipticus CBS 707.79]
MKWDEFTTERYWDLCEPMTVSWSHVENEDDKVFSIYLTNRVDYPPVTDLVLRYVRMDQDRVTIPAPGPLHIPYEYVPSFLAFFLDCHYRLWASAINSPETIYAETDVFCIGREEDRDRDRDGGKAGKGGKK